MRIQLKENSNHVQLFFDQCVNWNTFDDTSEAKRIYFLQPHTQQPSCSECLKINHKITKNACL